MTVLNQAFGTEQIILVLKFIKLSLLTIWTYSIWAITYCFQVLNDFGIAIFQIFRQIQIYLTLIGHLCFTIILRTVNHRELVFNFMQHIILEAIFAIRVFAWWTNFGKFLLVKLMIANSTLFVESRLLHLKIISWFLMS